MPEPSTKKIIEGIASRNASIIRYIYKAFYQEVKKLILMNNGSEEDAQDTFQEALYFIYQKITQHNLVITGRFGSYLYSVCKLLWLKELRERSYKKYQHWYSGDLITPAPVNKKLEVVKLKIFDRHFNELSEECQKILNMYFRKVSLEKMAEVFGYKSLQHIKDKKYRCKKTLMNKIFNNPEYKKVSDEIYLVG
jgi:RNA polymerase sigma factor (sigma-70 family)